MLIKDREFKKSKLKNQHSYFNLVMKNNLNYFYNPDRKKVENSVTVK